LITELKAQSSVPICSDPSMRNDPRYQKYCGQGNAPTQRQGGPAYNGPSAADIAAQQAAAAQQQRQSEAHELNQQGLDAFNSGDYQTAIKYFQDALDKAPDDSVIQGNIQKANEEIAARKQRQQQDFNQRKNTALSELRDLSAGGDFGSGLKGDNSAEF